MDGSQELGNVTVLEKPTPSAEIEVKNPHVISGEKKTKHNEPDDSKKLLEKARNAENVEDVRGDLALEAERAKDAETIEQANKLLFAWENSLKILKANLKNPAVIGSITAAGLGILEGMINIPLGSELSTSLGTASLGMALGKGGKEQLRNAAIGAAAGIALTHGLDTETLMSKAQVTSEAKGFLGFGDDIVLALATGIKKLLKK